MSESELLQAFRNERSEEALAELVRRYAGLVYSVAKRRVANATLAEDITQLVFIRFAKSPPKVLGPAQLAAWLHRTTLNVAIDTWRAETRRHAREQQAFAMQPAITEAAVWEGISPNLDEALNQLSEEDRQTLLLRFYGQKTMRDLGAATGVSEDAAKMRVSRAVGKLRTQLGVSGAACTATVLATLLAEHLVEAAPSHLVSRLASMRLPAAASIAGTGALLAAFLRISKIKLAVGAVALVAVVTGSVHLLRSSAIPVHEAVTPSPDTANGEQIGNANQQQIISTSFNAPPVTPPNPVLMLFRVVDAKTGDGLASTKIHAAHFGGGTQDLLTDNSGVAAISDPQDSTKGNGMHVFVVAEGYVPKVVSFGNAESPEYTIKLDPALAASGLVLDEQGLPVAGVKVQILGPEFQPGQREKVDFQLCAATSDEAGAWRFNYIPRNYIDVVRSRKRSHDDKIRSMLEKLGDASMFRDAAVYDEIRFILKKPGYAPTFPEVPASRVDLTNLVLVINRGATINGQITDPQARPITNALVTLLTEDSNQKQSTGTGESGVYTLTGVSTNMVGPEWSYAQPALETNSNGAVIVRAGYSFHGSYQFRSETNAGVELRVEDRAPWPGQTKYPEVKLAVQAEGFAPKTTLVECLQATNVANLTLTSGHVFRGRVIDEAGVPIANAVVRTDWDFKNQIPTRFDWSTHTDGAGQFEWASAPAEEICYWFEADGYTVIRGMPLPSDGQDHEITLTSKTTLR